MRMFQMAFILKRFIANEQDICHLFNKHCEDT